MAAEALLAVALLPLVPAALITSGLGGRRILRVGPLCALPALVASVVEIWPEVARAPWLFLGADVGLDQTGRLLLLVTAFVWCVAAAFAVLANVPAASRRRFFGFFYAAMAGNFLLIIAADMITFLVGFTLMSYAGWGLVVHKRRAESVRAARVYLVLVVFAEVLLLVGATLSWGEAGSWELAAIREALGQGGLVAQVATALLFVGFGVKAGMLPLHVWLPLAHPAAPVAASAVLSAAMIKAGLLGWLRFLPVGYPGWEWLGMWAVIAGLMAAFFGVGLGLLQSKPKTILAYSSISQMGYMTLLVGIAAWLPELYPAVILAVLVYAVHHAVAKGALFLAVAVVADAPQGKGWKIAEAAGLVIPALALAGAPLTTGSIAKEELKAIPYLSEGDLPVILDPALILGAVATTVLMARFLWVVWPRDTRHRKVSRRARGVWLLLATSVLWAPWIMPWAYLRRAAASAVTPEAAWAAFWPLAVGALLSLIVIRRRNLFAWRVEETIPAGDLVVPAITVWRYTSRAVLTRLVAGQRRWHAAVRGVVHIAGVQWQRILLLRFVEQRLRKQAWNWVWILVVALALLVALVL